MGLRVIDFETLVEEGKKFPQINFSDIKVSPSDIYTFSFTSGTTGPPKCAMISHSNLLSFLSSFGKIGIGYTEDEVYLSFLPLPHLFERLVFSCLFFSGGSLV
jgi:long-chain acyl-CoA synthetase